MSLVICSNDIPTGISGTSQFQAPFSWSNHLDQPLRIPPNSSVAVSSLKINKDGSYSVGPANKWYGYYGEELSGSMTLEETTSAPILADLGIDRNTDVTTDELAVLIQGGMNRAVPNPESFGLATCIVDRDAVTQEFKGFKTEFKSRTNASTLNVLPQDWVDSYPPSEENPIGGLSFDSATNRLTATTNDKNYSKFNVAIGTDNPLALNGGEYILQIDQAVNTSWAMGLTRSWTTAKPPTYFNEDDSELTRNTNLFGDFIVGAFATTSIFRYIRVLHAVYKGDGQMTMVEVDYTTGGGAFTDPLLWNASNSAQWTKSKMEVDGEAMRVSLYNASTAKWDKLVDYPLGNVNAIKGTIMKPIADTCRNLYPLAFISRLSAQGAAPPVTPRYLTVEKFGGRVIEGLKYGITDWWGQLEAKGLTEMYGSQVDFRPYNDTETALTHTYLTAGVSGYIEDYEFVLIIKPDNIDYVETEQAAASVMLGFPNIPVLDSSSITANANGGGYWSSVSPPELRSTTSLFVRLNSLPVNTFNAGTSGQSKIIYSAPRFSTGTDKSTGAMFYECPQRTYISLNNPNELVVNTFDIDIVNADETVASDLLGKSVVVLHIKKDSEQS
tara:strand:- start:3104 stop:4939 length:1836 start_codon:yes stop_codon:yes gene_type:complete